MPASKAKQAETAARRSRLIQLRAAGLSWSEIATALDYSAPAAAAVDWKRAMADERGALAEESSDSLALELARMDSLTRSVETVLGRARSSHDNGAVLRSVDRLLRISQRRSALLGLEGSQDRPEPEHPADELKERRERRRRTAGG